MQDQHRPKVPIYFSAEAYATTIRIKLWGSFRKLVRPFPSSCTWRRPSAYARQMLDPRPCQWPQLSHLERIPNSERPMFQIALLMYELSVPPADFWDIEKSKTAMEVRNHKCLIKSQQWDLDNILVRAIARLYLKQGLPEAAEVTKRLNEEKSRLKAVHISAYCTRSLQLLREIPIRETAPAIVEKTIGSRLPPELVVMIIDAYLGSYGIARLDKEFEEAWTSPPPNISWDGCFRVGAHPWKFPTKEVRRGCGAWTCHHSSIVKWLRKEHKWVIVHGIRPSQQRIICPDRNCLFHHDMDFQADVQTGSPQEHDREYSWSSDGGSDGQLLD